MGHARDQLELLLREDKTACNAREQRAFLEATREKPEIVLFGAGGLGRKVLSTLRSEGKEPLGFIDNKLAGHTIEGLKVLSPSDGAQKWGPSACFVVTIWASWADTMREQIRSLRELGCETTTSFIPLLWKHPELLPHVQVDLPSRVLEQKEDIRRAFDLWEDEQSRTEFVAQLRWRLLGDFEELGDPLRDQYWQRDLIHLCGDSVFVDAGAFDGDTLAQFVDFTGGKFRRAYLFEPDRQNRSVINDRLKALPEDIRSRVEVFGFAVAEREFDVSFDGGAGASSAPGSGTDVVHCVTLDHALPEPPDLIKYDIEGFELLGLSGTRRIIAEHSPYLTVCAYHTQSHLWEIPLLIHSMNPNYGFYLRPHGQIWETVCYAVPRKRVT